jgi:NAD(P)-dependent dehydrogenase (short-subunit alcohol dehydrogenase family)
MSSSKRQRSEQDAFGTRAREGYFGASEAVTDSNASAGNPRIVLDDQYGQPRGGSLGKLALTAEVVREQLDGCANRYAGKTVIVTGGARGIGEGCVRVFFEAGSNVVCADRDEGLGKALVEELNRTQGSAAATTTNRALFVRTDVSVVADLEQLVSETVDAFGRIDCVLNNAGWHPPHKVIDDFSVDDMQNLLQLNFVSVFALCKLALPHLRKVKGNIINMASWVGSYGQSKAVTYAATKGATLAFTKALAVDEAAHHVRVNSVSPGNIW